MSYNLFKLIKKMESDVNAPDYLVAAVKKLNMMSEIHLNEEAIPDELAERMFNATGARRNYGEERRAIIKFMDEL